MVVSDFRGPLDWRRPLLQLLARHQVLAVEIRDPREQELPDVGELWLVDPGLVSYAVSLAAATRNPGGDLARYVSFGASPRGPISITQSARALALVRGRDYVTTEDVRELAKDALRHRIVLSYEALAESVDADTILDSVLSTVPVPEVSLARP